MKKYYVYIISNYNSTTLYVDLTNDLYRRMQEHKLKLHKGSFSAKYNLDRLLFSQEFTNKDEAILQEKRIKKYKREWKENLINGFNPSWRDLSEDFKVSEK